MNAPPRWVLSWVLAACALAVALAVLDPPLFVGVVAAAGFLILSWLVGPLAVRRALAAPAWVATGLGIVVAIRAWGLPF